MPFCVCPLDCELKKFAETIKQSTSRVTVVDFGKGFSIFAMIALHSVVPYVTMSGGSLSSYEWIWASYFQLYNGLFFILSGFGNYFSIHGQLKRARKKNPQNPRIGCIVVLVIVRGVLTMLLAYMFNALLRKWLFETVFWDVSHPNRTRPNHATELGDIIVSEAFSPCVVPFIGFTSMINGLVVLLVMTYGCRQTGVCAVADVDGGGPSTRLGGANGEEEKDASASVEMVAIEDAVEPDAEAEAKAEAENVSTLVPLEDSKPAQPKTTAPPVNQRRLWRHTQVLMCVIGAILGLNPLFRRALDHSTCSPCVATKCTTLNSAKVADAYATMPERCFVTHVDKFDFSDVSGFDPCAEPANRTSCRKWVKKIGKKVSGSNYKMTTGLAHMSRAERGLRWCPATVARDNVAADASLPTKLEVCQLMPKWGPPNNYGGTSPGLSRDRVGVGMNVLQVLLVPWFGRYGYFAYGATSLLGFVLAMNVAANGWTRKLFIATFSAAFGFLVLGTAPALGTFAFDSVEGIQMASTWIRMHVGGGELFVFTLMATFMEGRPHSGCYNCASCCCGGCCGVRAPACQRHCGNCCAAPCFKKSCLFRFMRLFGVISFTVYMFQWWVLNVVALVINAMGGFKPPFCMTLDVTTNARATMAFPEDSECYQCIADEGRQCLTFPTLLIYVAGNLLVWYGLLEAWSRVNFAGSFEWLLQSIFNVARGKNMCSVTPVLTQHGFWKGVSGLREDDIPYCEMWPCCCCWKACKPRQSTKAEMDKVASTEL